MKHWADKLVARGLSMRIFTPPQPGDGWVIWLYADDDPGLGVITGDGDELEEAIHDAIEAWDQGRPREVVPS